MRALTLALLTFAACRTELPPIEPPDFAGADLAGRGLFTGIFAWDSANATSRTVCDNGGNGTSAPTGDFPITAGPADGQVNIGYGSGACPVFVFDVSGDTATLSNLGVTCPSGPGVLTTHSGSLAITDGGTDAQLTVVLDLELPSGDTMVHCVLTVSGRIARAG